LKSFIHPKALLNGAQSHMFHGIHERLGYTLCQLGTILFTHLSPRTQTTIVPLKKPYATKNAFVVLKGDDESETCEIGWVDVRDETWVGLFDLGERQDLDVDDLDVGGG
jgi:hypothetical protein